MRKQDEWRTQKRLRRKLLDDIITLHLPHGACFRSNSRKRVTAQMQIITPHVLGNMPRYYDVVWHWSRILNPSKTYASPHPSTSLILFICLDHMKEKQERIWKWEEGSTGPARKWGGGTDPTWSAVKNFVVLLYFLVLKVQLVVFGERFHDGQYSLASFLFAGPPLTVPPCPAICKSGEGYVPPALWRRRHWTQLTKTNYRPCPLNAAHFSTVAYMDWKAKLIATPLLLIFLFKFICLLSK